MRGALLSTAYREMLLNLVAPYSEGFLIVLVDSCFGRTELGEEMTPFYFFVTWEGCLMLCPNGLRLCKC